MKLYSPKHRPAILPEKDFASQYARLEETLSQYANKGRLPSYDSLELEYEYYLVENARANVVIVHGYTEFIRKYRELCHYLMEMGFNVFIYDQRGHGLSGRETESLARAHVSSFDAYVQDLECIIQSLVLPASDKPVYLFSHSMGGAISLLYMQKHPDAIEKAVLSAPMVKPHTPNVPVWIMIPAIRRQAEKYGYDTPSLGARKFSPKVRLEDTNDQSYGRFKMSLETRISDVRYQASECTNSWILEALQVRKRLFKDTTRRISTKILILTAQNDGAVDNTLQLKLLPYLRHVTHYTVADGKHNLLNGSEFILEEVYGEIRRFLD